MRGGVYVIRTSGDEGGDMLRVPAAAILLAFGMMGTTSVFLTYDTLKDMSFSSSGGSTSRRFTVDLTDTIDGRPFTLPPGVRKVLDGYEFTIDGEHYKVECRGP